MLHYNHKSYQEVISYLRDNFEKPSLIYHPASDFINYYNLSAIRISDEIYLAVNYSFIELGDLHFMIYFCELENMDKLLVQKISEFEKILDKLPEPLKEFFLFRIDIFKEKMARTSLFDLYNSIFN